MRSDFFYRASLCSRALRHSALLMILIFALSGRVAAQIYLSDDFDPGIDPAVWESFGGTVVANTNGQNAGPGSTGNSMWFGGSGSRFASTVPVNTIGGGNVRFSIALGNNTSAFNLWENVDVPSEAIVLEYSVDGITYTAIGDPFQGKLWQGFQIAIPVEAESPQTRFRFRQKQHSGPAYDHWAIEDFSLEITRFPDIAVEESSTDLATGVSNVNFGSALVFDAVIDKTFVVRNVGDFDLEGLSVEIVGDASIEFGTSVSSLDSTVAPSGTTSFTVSFAPQAVGPRTARLRITSSDPDENPFEINLSGTGTAPEIQIANGTGGLSNGLGYIDFGAGIPGVALHTETFTISNTGTGPLRNIQVQKQGTFPSDYVHDLSGMQPTLNPGESTTFTVTFTPGGLGPRNAGLRIVSNDLNNNQFNIQLRGEGIAPDIAVAENSVDLANGAETIDYGTSLLGVATAPKTFIISNTGTATLSGISATITGSAAADYYLTGATPTANLEPGENTEIEITFAAGGLGTRNAQLSIASSDPDEAPFLINLTAAGQGIPEIDLEQPAGTPVYSGGASIDFGIVGLGSSSAAKIFTVNNPGTDFLTGLAVTVEGNHST